MKKNIFGYTFAAFALLLTVIAIADSPELPGLLTKIPDLVTNQLENDTAGELISKLILWAIHITLTILLWNLSFRWVKHQDLEEETGK